MSQPTPPAPGGPSQPPQPAQPPQPHGPAPARHHADPPLGPPAIQAPWRLEYLEALEKKEKHTGPPGPGSGSFLRDYWLNPAGDVKNHVIARTEHGIICLNAFPYANGHLLVALGEPAPRLLDYTSAQRATFWALVDTACDLLERTLQPQGVNLGINQGRAAGAGVPQHLHAHLVPRWNGDVNFITVVGQIRVIPSSLDAMAAKFRAVWAQLRG